MEGYVMETGSRPGDRDGVCISESSSDLTALRPTVEHTECVLCTAELPFPRLHTFSYTNSYSTDSKTGTHAPIGALSLRT